MKKKISLPFERDILHLIRQNSGLPLHRAELSKALNIHKGNYHAFAESLQSLVRQGLIVPLKGKQFALPKSPAGDQLSGELRTTKSGSGWVIVPGREQDIFISAANLNTAFDRDTVEVKLFAGRKGSRPEGFIQKVLGRFREYLTGTLRITGYYTYVVPDDPKIYRDIIIQKDLTGQAKDGQKVLVHFEEWEKNRHNPEGIITEILGTAGDPGLDVTTIAWSYNISTRFKPEVDEAARSFSTRFSEADLEGRLDLRHETCFTIDPDDAKDFDDAVSLERLANGNWFLGVHIADVSHYVKENSVLDKESFKRGTSVYLVDRVIPMLPEFLSNDLCSLRPEEDRLTFSCRMEIAPASLQVVRYEIRPSIIHSKRRYHYEEVQNILDGGQDDRFASVLKDMHQLSKAFTRQRLEAGGIDFDTPEVRFRLDEQGRPTEVIPKKRLDSHRLIEEFMLLANQTVARHVGQPKDDGKRSAPFIYRIHEKPDVEKTGKFIDLLKALNIPYPQVRKINSRFFQEVLASIKGTKEEIIVEEVALRSMMKAIYSETNVGHFGLGFEYYTHFTSPIRRYPDLIVHRLLRLYAGSGNYSHDSLFSRLQIIARQSSKMERLAVEAERDSIKLKQTEYMEQFVGQEFKGIVSGVTSYGFFVELAETLIEGMVELSSLSDDYYIYDEVSYMLIGRDTGKIIRLGDDVMVRVEQVVAEKRQINFALTELLTDHKPLLNKKPQPRSRSGRRK